jgi:putative tricarboxylic transport membrane protein
LDTIHALLNGFSVALTPANLLWALIGVTCGTAVGILPGIGPALTVALLLPVTHRVDPTGSIIMFAGVYYGAQYGSSTTAILLNTPGESSSIVTAIEGNRMARAGRGAAALATAAIGSFVAGTLGTIALTLSAPYVVSFALKFGPADYFALMVLALATVSTVLGSSQVRGLASLGFGLTLGMVGIDMQTGQERFTLGIPELRDGIGIVIVAVGLFAVGEALFMAARPYSVEDEIIPVKGRIWMTRDEWKRSWKPWLRGALIGFPMGALPAGGAEIPTFLSYAIEKRLSKRGSEFGTGSGAIEGVAGPEATNNAAGTGVLVPLLTLGLPTSATASMILVAFQQYGIQPGPLLFQSQPALVWGLIASLYIGNVMLLVLNLPMVGLWVRLLSIPRECLYAGILVLATLGTYSLDNSTFDLILLAVIGTCGYFMRCFDIPLAPTIVGLIVGPMAEQQFRRAAAISQGDLTVFFTRPIAATLMVLAVCLLLGPRVAGLIERRKLKRAEAKAASAT